MGTINNISYSSGRMWKHKLNHPAWANTHEQRDSTEIVHFDSKDDVDSITNENEV